MKIILFDGLCNFCDSTVQLIIKFDRKAVFKFASQQSEIGKKLLIENGYSFNQVDTIILISNNLVFTKSEAAIEILRDLGGVFKICVILKIFPVKIRDIFYDVFARNRYRIFGKKNECMLPSASIINRFLQ